MNQSAYSSGFSSFCISETIFKFFQLGGIECAINEIQRHLQLIIKSSELDQKYLDLKLASFTSCILIQFLGEDSRALIREQIHFESVIRQNNLLSPKVHAICSAFKDFFIRWDGASTPLSYQIISFLEQSETEELKTVNVSALADHFGFSPSHVSRIFKKETGNQLQKVIHSAKLSRAHQLLSPPSDSQTVSMVAKSLGFQSVNYFRRSFKRKFGYPPGTLIKSSSEILVGAEPII